MKKVLSLVLVIAMVLSSMSFAFAAKFEDVSGNYENAVNALSALGVISGYGDGTFRPENQLTRAELAVMLVKSLGYADLVAGANSNFSDTQTHWSNGYVAIAAGTGLVQGYPDGTFRPDNGVTYDEAYTMVIRALGYKDSALTGSWPTNFKVKAIDLGLTKKVAMNTAAADRGGVAQVFFNALEKVMVTVDAENKITNVKDADDENVLLLNKIAKPNKNFVVDPKHIDAESKDFASEVIDLAPYMYQDLSVYLNDDDQVVYVKKVNSLTFTGTVTAVTTANITIEDANEDEYTFKTTTAANIDFMYNGEDAGAYDDTVLMADEAQVTVILQGENGDKIRDNVMEVVAVVATQVSAYIQVEDVYVKDELILDSFALPKDGKVVDTDNLVIKGDAESLEDIEEDDVLSVYVPVDSEGDFYTDAPNKMTIVVSRETVEGKITKISGTDHYIDGKAYKVNANGDAVTAGDEGIFYLDHAGKIFAFVEEGSTAPANYALVLKKTDGYQTTPGGVILADPKVKLLTASGEEITYVLDTDLANAIVDDSTGQDIVVGLTPGEVVEYDLDKDNVIDELTVVTMEAKVGGGALEIATDVNSFNLAKNAVIFNVPGGTVADASVIEADELDDDIEAFRYRNTKGEIEVLVVTKGGAEEEGIFALITKDDGSAWDEDEEKSVQMFTAYVDGAKVEYLAHKDIDTVTPPVKGNVIVDLTLSNGKLKDTTPVASVTGTAINARVTNSITDDKGTVSTTDDVTYFLSDDVVVYVIKANGSFDKVGTKNDIRNNDFVAYDTVDSDGDYDVVVVFLK